jgi:CDP-glycerol glycerophosphotransferase (TagB/SpsB family)
MNYKFLIYISYSYAVPIGDPLEIEILNRGFTINWFSDLDEGARALKKKTNVINNIHDVIVYNPDIILTITDTVPDFLKGLKVQIFHGFPANKRKGTDQFKIRGFFDLYCTQGTSSTEIFKKASIKYKTFEVIETGWSKMDSLFPLTNNEDSKNIPVILIASTFTKQYSLALKEDVINEIKRLSKIGKWHFMIVLHPKLPEVIKKKIKSIQNKNLVYHDTTNLIPLFKQSDILLSDTTSAIIEFLLQEKPVVTIRNNMPGPYLIDISLVSEIENAIERALIRPPELLREIKKFAAFSHVFSDGKSSERVITASIDFLHKDKSHLKSKPINLVRKFKIRKRLGYFTFKSFNKAFTIELKNNNG